MVVIDSTSFGSITIDEKKYDYDVIVTWQGKIKEGMTETRHLISEQEFLKLIFERPDVIVIGTGHGRCLNVSSKVLRFAKEKRVETVILPTPQAADKFNELCKAGKRVVAYVHVTC